MAFEAAGERPVLVSGRSAQPASLAPGTPLLTGMELAEAVAMLPAGWLHVGQRERADVSAERSELGAAIVRCVDVLLAAIGLVLAVPILLLAALALRVDTPGPVVFRQVRVGKDGKPFTFVKLRGMYADATTRFPELYEPRYAAAEPKTFYFHLSNDPRVTRVGRRLRRWSIDELPNLWNLLKGDITLVGPRPQIPQMFSHYGRYREPVLSIKPGLTSLPKALGRDNLTLRETVLLDAWYVEHRSVTLDLRILLATALIVLRSRAVF